MTIAARLRSTALPLALVCSAIAVAQAPPPEGDAPGGGRQMGPRGPGGPMAEERKILERFDTDGNGRLEGAERDAARAELKKTPQRGGRGGMRGPGGPGGPRAETKPGPKVSPKDVRSFPDAPLFDPGVVRTVFLEFDVASWEEELELFHNTDADVPARMTVDGKAYEGVGVHFRGASSYMMVPRGTKRSLNIAVDHTDPKAALYGQNTLNLLNSNADASMMSSVLYAHLARPHLPAPRANFVHVVVNGESWGVYVNVEQFNKAFLRERWPEFKGEGARWKVRGSPNGTGGLDYRGEGLEPYRQRYEIKTKDSKKDWEALVTLCRTLSETPIDGLEAALRPMLDIDGALWFLALDAATANTDGYWVRASDYSLYRDPKGVFHLVPHDMNEAFKLAHGGPGGPGGMRPGFGPGFGPDGPPPDMGPQDGPPPGFGPDDGPREDRPRFGRPRSAPGAVAGPQDAPPMPDDRPPGVRPGRESGGRSLVELDPFVAADDPTKPLRSRLLKVPALREKYLANIRQIAEEMRWERMGPVVASNRALIADLVAADTRKSSSTEAFERATAPEGAGGLREFLEKRSQYLLGDRPSEPKEEPKRPAQQ